MEQTSNRETEEALGLKFPHWACVAALSFSVLMLVLLAGNAFWIAHRDSEYMAENMELQALRGMLLYYDEALTMSVSMATVDSSSKWEQRFIQLEEKLQKAIDRSMEKAPTPGTFQTAAELERANEKLLRIERGCFDRIRQGDAEGARLILEGEEYQRAKDNYSQQTRKLANELLVQMQQNQSRQKWSLSAAVALVFIILILIGLVWSVVIRHLRKWRNAVVEQYESRSRAERELRVHAENLEKTVAARTAEIQQSMKATEAFSYSLAHDLRAPARALQGFAKALVEDYGPSLDENGREYATRILTAAGKMDRLIGDLMNYARVGQNVPLQPVDLQLLLSQVLTDLEGEIKMRNAEVRVDAALPMVTGNPTLLALVFANLIENGMKYVAPGVQPKVDIFAKELARTVKISVSDNGIGIDPRHHERIFGIFERLHGEAQYTGTGIGLAIVRRAMERMQGTVGIVSQVGQGTTFWIELPKADVAVEDNALATAEHSRHRSRPGG